MPILHAIVLGITQGLSEFLPISSSGHLILVPWLFGWDDFAGDASLEKTFDVALHLGTLVGATAYFRADIVRYLRAAFTSAGRGTDDRRLAWLLVVATVPAAVTGALFADAIEEHTGSIPLVATMLIVFGVLLWWADRLPSARPLEDVRAAGRAVHGRRSGHRPPAGRVALRRVDDLRADGGARPRRRPPASRSS